MQHVIPEILSRTILKRKNSSSVSLIFVQLSWSERMQLPMTEPLLNTAKSHLKWPFHPVLEHSVDLFLEGEASNHYLYA